MPNQEVFEVSGPFLQGDLCEVHLAFRGDGDVEPEQQVSP